MVQRTRRYSLWAVCGACGQLDWLPGSGRWQDESGRQESLPLEVSRFELERVCNTSRPVDSSRYSVENSCDKNRKILKQDSTNRRGMGGFTFLCASCIPAELDSSVVRRARSAQKFI